MCFQAEERALSLGVRSLLACANNCVIVVIAISTDRERVEFLAWSDGTLVAGDQPLARTLSRWGWNYIVNISRFFRP